MAIEKVIIQNFKKFKNPFEVKFNENINLCLLYTSPSPRDTR